MSDEQITEKPEVTDEHREKAKEMAKAYQDDRPTVGLPGTSNTVTGQAVSEWIDEDGNPKFGEVEEGGGVKREDVMGVREESMGDESKEESS
ncbi:hypothetical protein H7K45_11840 [Mycobacterium yunnanensis]|uniref:Uncharacterized protein n=1 Tax=Mycobacterium yunnanensis TaxID=368477 RepID=A0A9X2YZM1_9MYCO|nr:hypothetical protein [Mycobacterium yunnanensis]MCV7421233.1 hypothetical protein [Mycobacterium yunnanensis]